MPRIAVLFSLLLVASLVWHPNARVYPQRDFETEAYAFYSDLYRDWKESNPGESLAFAARPEPLRLDSGCNVHPRTAEEREMAKDGRHIFPFEWKRRFQLTHGYVLIPVADVDRAINCFGRAPEQAAGCEIFAGIKHVRFLSVPVFNRDHTRALIATYRACGGLCGQGGMYVYRKSRNGWEQESSSFARCLWIS